MATAATVWKNAQNSIIGGIPTWLVGTDAIDGDAVPFVSMRVGSKYTLVDTTNDTAVTYEKVKNDGADNDWSAAGGMLVISETFTPADCVDSTTTGTYTLNQSPPIGSLVIRSGLFNVTGWAGDTSAVATIGTAADADRFMVASTLDVFSTVAALDGGVPSGATAITVATTVQVVITSASDFTSVVTNGSGVATVKLFCLL